MPQSLGRGPIPTPVPTASETTDGTHGRGPASQDSFPFPNLSLTDLGLSRERVRFCPGQLLGERYRLVRRLGAGGMGEVWEAVHVVIEKPVAIKILLDDDAHAEQHLPERFMREAHAIAAVRHDNIVDITDFGHTPTGSPYFVMELLEGRTLRQAIKEDGAFPWERARALLLQLAEGLEAVHVRGIVHRDLKPDNVFVISRGHGREQCKIIDFGIAKVTMLDSRAKAFTRTGLVFGTPAFMSPEQARGEKVDARADIYAVGCLAYEMLSGQRAFCGETPTEVLFKQLFADPISLRQHNESLPSEVEAIVLRCLRKDPEDRFGSIAEVRQALLAVGTGSPAVSVPPQRFPTPPEGIMTQPSSPSASQGSLLTGPSWIGSQSSLSAGESAIVTRRQGSIGARPDSLLGLEVRRRTGNWLLLGASLLLLVSVAAAWMVRARVRESKRPADAAPAAVVPSAVPPLATVDSPASNRAAHVSPVRDPESADPEAAPLAPLSDDRAVPPENIAPQPVDPTPSATRPRSRVTTEPAVKNVGEGGGDEALPSDEPSTADGSPPEGSPDETPPDEPTPMGPIRDADLLNPFRE